MPIILEGTVKLGQPGSDVSKTSKCQVLTVLQLQTSPNARSIMATMACYVDKAAYEAGKNPMDGGNGLQAGIGGDKLESVLDTTFKTTIENVTMQMFADYLITTEQFGAISED